MRWLTRWFIRGSIACFAVALADAQDPALLARIKARADENLRRLPNYTCTETIERSLRTDRRARLRRTDTVHLDVAYVEGKELFGRPGQHRIDQSDLGKLVDGPIGNGQFALFAKSIFQGHRGTFGPAVNAKIEGKPAFRFEYTLPLSQSGFHIESAVGEAIVGYSGSFWVARDTLDLMRLMVSADDLPAQLKIAYDLTVIDYAPVLIGGRLFPLPRRTNWETKGAFGEQARNVTIFENCREFVGESVLKFGDTDPPPAGK